jgi:uncharacterized membrane protein
MTQTDNTRNDETGRPKKEIIITDADALVLGKKLRAGRWLTLGCYAGLLLLFTLLNIMRDAGNLKLWMMQCIPLLVFIPALRNETHRSYSWLCFVALMYFVAIVPLLMGRWWWSDWLITILVTVLFIASMMTSRWLQYWNYYLYTKTQSTQAPVVENSNT